MNKKFFNFKRQQDVVIFPAGEMNISLDGIREYLSLYNHRAVVWHDLFNDADDMKINAILPFLLKKLPTFDFALILYDANDDDSFAKSRMLYWLGLCTMALGMERVIVISRRGAHLPDELLGVGGLGAHVIDFVPGEDTNDIMDKAQSLMELSDSSVSPVVIGASVSTADGYFNNYIMCIMENIEKGFTNTETDEFIVPELSNIDLRIMVPKHLDMTVRARIKRFYDAYGLMPGRMFGGINIHYTLINGRLTLLDIPSAVTASLSTAKDILDFNADDKFDDNAEQRFLTKEMDNFYHTLERLISPLSVQRKLEHNGLSVEQKKNIADALMRIKISSSCLESF